MNKEKYIQDLEEIKSLMQRSTKFISLSGLSGVIAGVIALIGALIAYILIQADRELAIYGHAMHPFKYLALDITQNTANKLIILGATILILAVVLGYVFTNRNAIKKGEKLWNKATKKMVVNLLIPLVTGGIFCLVMIYDGYYGFVAPGTLIFYGLACVNASHYTLSDIRKLGIVEIILGLFNLIYIGYGLLFWTIGFGVFHILYGYSMYLKYEKGKK